MTTKNTLLYFSLLLIFITTLHCKSHDSSIAQKAMYKSIYIDQFRLTYFRQMLIKSYNNSNAVREIINNDHSGFTEPMLTAEDHKLIDTLTTLDNDKMKIDSTEGNRRAEGAQGKRPLSFILNKLTSRWLDSIADARYKASGVQEFYHN